MFARMNDELGALQLTNGWGADMNSDILGRTIRLGAREGQGIVGYVAAKGALYVAGNVEDEPLYKDLLGSSKSEVAVPIRDRHDRIRAVLNVESDKAENFDTRDVETIEFLASMASLVLTRDEQQIREEAMLEIRQALDRAVTEDDLLGQILKITAENLRFQSCAIFLWDAHKEEFTLRAGTGTLADLVGKAGYAAGNGLTGWVAKNGTPVRLERPQEDPRWRGQLLELPSDEIAGYLAVPVLLKGRCLGVIRVVRRVSENPHHDNRFTEDDERILEVVAHELAAGLEAIRSVGRLVQVERMAAWGEISAKSSHMIGNRVFALQGDVNELGHILKSQNPNLDEIHEVQASLVTQVTRLQELLQEFRDFVSATQLSPARADFNALVREAITEVFPRRGGVSLVFDLEEDLPECDLDARKFRRAVTEVVENSLSFFDKGTLRVTTGIAPLELIQMAHLSSGKLYNYVEILDEGPGVDFDKKTLIFQPFFSSRVKGMGLGLSIVKGILEAHGGQVLEIGEPGKGAQFMMLVPCVLRH
jgi:signal transduction histidine kinase